MATALEEPRSTDEFARLFEFCPELLCVAGFDGKFKRVNPAFEATLGYGADELLARPFASFVHPDDREATLAEAAKLAAGRRTVSFENRYRCRNGSYVWLLWTAMPNVDEKRIYAAAREISERKRAEQTISRLNAELARRVAELEELTGELEAFTYSVSHDLRAPLRAIEGFSKILLEEHEHELSEVGRRYFGLIQDGARQMAGLIDGLLSFSRLGRAPLKRQPVDPKSLVDAALAQLQFELDGRDVEVAIGELPPCEGDPTLLEQVFVNLLSNALKYSRTRAPARIEIGSSRDDEVVYFVRDNGVGFDPGYAHKLFGVFERLHRAEDYEGNGLGLALVRRIVQRHGGRIWAESAEGRGATFSFTIGEAGRG
jgi:PAS domain S-box-containing protein